MSSQERDHVTTEMTTASSTTQNTLMVLLGGITCELLKHQQKNGKNKTVQRISSMAEQLLQALSGTDVCFIRHEEYYHDLKETLKKMLHSLQTESRRNFLIRRCCRFVLPRARKSRLLHEMGNVVDGLCGRIFFSYAQRRIMKIAQ